jgi:hypothetical protein
VFAAAALAALSAIGCGGPSEEEKFRKDKLRPAQQQIERAKSQVAAQLRVVHLGRKRDAELIGRQVDALSVAIDRMRALKPPESVASEFVAFGGANARLVGTLRGFARALGGRSKARLDRAAARAQAAAGEVARARNALYDGLAK